MATKQKKPYDIKGRKKTFVVANRSDKGKKRPTYNSKNRIKSPAWFARSKRDDRKAYIEMVTHCEKNIKDLYTSKRYEHLSEETKDMLAVDMLNTRKEAKKLFAEKYKNDLIKHKKELDTIKKRIK